MNKIKKKKPVRKRAQNAPSRHTEEFYRMVADFTHDWEYWVDPRMNVIYMSPSCERITGYSKEEFINNPKLLQKIVHPDDKTAMNDHLREIEESRKAISMDFRIVRRDGEAVWVNHVCQPIHDSKGKYLGRRVSNRDVSEYKQVEKIISKAQQGLEARVKERTQELARINVELQNEVGVRKRAEAEITSLEKQIEFILGATKTGLDIIDSSFEIQYIDPAWASVYGDYRGKKCFEYFMGRSSICPGCGVKKALDTKQIVITEEILEREGNRPIQVTTIPFQNDKGEWLVAEVNVDLTERKRIEKALLESEARYRSLVEQIPAITYTAALDEVRTTLFISPQVERMLGFSSAEYRSDPDIWRKQLHPDDHDRVMAALISSHVSGRPFTSAYRMFAKDGTIRWFRDSAVVLRDSQGVPMCFQGVMYDITDQKLQEEDLEESRERYRAVVENIPIGVSLISPDMEVLTLNSQMERWFPGAELKDRPVCYRIFNDSSRNEACVNCPTTRVFQDGQIHETLIDATREGLSVIYKVTSSAIKDINDRVIAAVEMVEDITARRRSEKLLEESEERYRRIISMITDYIYTVSIEKGQPISTVYGPTCFGVTGYTDEEFKADPYLWINMVYPEDRPAVEEWSKCLLSGKPCGSIEHRILRKDNGTRWIRNTPVLHHNAKGELTAYDGVVQDITDRKMSGGH